LIFIVSAQVEQQNAAKRKTGTCESKIRCAKRKAQYKKKN